MYSKSIHYWYWIQIGYVLLDIIAIFIEELMSYFFDRFIKISMIAENCVTGFMAACRFPIYIKRTCNLFIYIVICMLSNSLSTNKFCHLKLFDGIEKVPQISIYVNNLYIHFLTFWHHHDVNWMTSRLSFYVQ